MTTANSGPLSGIDVVDFSTALAGPWLAGILADQGAEVIKVEQPGSGDQGRASGTMHGGVSAMFHLANRAKRSIAVNLQEAEGRAIALDLAAGADVVVQNYRPGVAERLGVGYEQVRARNADVVFVAVTGFGPTGPYCGRPALDSVIQAYSGTCDLQRSLDTGEPQFVTQTIADKVAALAGAQATVAALLARERGRGGQRVDVPMLDVAIAFNWMDAAGKETLLDAPPELSSFVTGGRRVLEFADGHGVVAVGTDAAFPGVCATLGIDPERYSMLATAEGRAMHRTEFVALMAEMVAAAKDVPLAAAAEQLIAHGAPFGIVNRVADVHRDPHVVASGLFAESDHPTAGRIREPTPPIRFSGTPTPLRGSSPALGEHTDEILEHFGRTDVAELRRRGVVA